MKMMQTTMKLPQSIPRALKKGRRSIKNVQKGNFVNGKWKKSKMSCFAATDAVNMGEIGRFVEGFARGTRQISLSLNSGLPHISCAESVDIYSNTDEDGQETNALLTMVIDPRKCPQSPENESFEKQYCVIKLLPELAYNSELFDIQCKDVE